MRIFKYVVLMVFIAACISGCIEPTPIYSPVSGILYEVDGTTPSPGTELHFLDGRCTSPSGCSPDDISEYQSQLITTVITDDEGRFSVVTEAGWNFIYIELPVHLRLIEGVKQLVKVDDYFAERDTHTELILVKPDIFGW